ncbi:hypothetical protein [uncultured Ruegeria sp.]|uniref:hypothetical protein n=1 Tax=uncultured Ruegeria sp. TaxID=259304 RepID=UPI0026269B84|nr:hypothetical protein [uncultured Ruegeria sp.]
MKHERATPGTAAANAYAMHETDTDRIAAMWAACALMALHDRRSDVFREYAESWASKLRPPSSQ